MKVKLISYTKPIDEIVDPHVLEQRNLENFIAYVARVSNPTNQNNTETSLKLIDYLIKHKHWSPFEICHITLEIETTRDIGRQILRHRSFSFQEFSQRYADPTSMEFDISEARLQDTKNRQNSIEIEDVQLQERWEESQEILINNAKNVYKWAIDNGIAKEVARKVLPEGLTTTRMYMSGSLRSWIHYLQLRTEKGTQKEHREVASACSNEIAKVFPKITELLKQE